MKVLCIYLGFKMCFSYLIYLLLKDKFKAVNIKFKKKTLKVLLADSFFKRAIGLMYRKNLKEDGMLFVFKKEGNYTITMRNMYFGIDVFWLDKKGRIQEIASLEPSLFYYKPKNKSKYILELKKNKIRAKIGESFDLH